MDRHMNSVLSGISERIVSDRAEAVLEAEDHEDSTAGSGGAHNVSDVNDAFDKYISDIVDALCVDYGCDDDFALECLRSAIDELVSEGALTPIPEEGDLDGTALWMGTAKSVGLGGYARKACHDAL